MMEMEDRMDSALLREENGMRLLDGRVLELYPRVEKESEEGNHRRDAKFFLENVFFFVAHYEEILSDSRMFLAPVPVKKDSFWLEAPTLGGYIEWWMRNAQWIERDENGRLYIPLSGCYSTINDKRIVVDECGMTRVMQECDDFSCQRSFRDITRRYDECREAGMAYSLSEVKEILCQKEQGDFIERAHRNLLSWMVDCLVKLHEQDVKTIRNMKFDEYAEEMELILSRYHEEVDESKDDIELYHRHIAMAKRRLNQGVLTPAECQSYIETMKEEIAKEEQHPKDIADTLLRHYFGCDKFYIKDLLEWEAQREIEE